MFGVLDEGVKLDWSLTPMQVMRRWPATRRLVMLCSGRYDARWARYSILAEPQGDYRFIQNPDGSGQSHWLGSDALVNPTDFHHQPAGDLRTLLASGAGLWIGYLGYELGQWFEPTAMHTGPVRAQDDRHWPLIDLACCPGYLVHDAATGFWTVHGQWSSDWWKQLPELPENAGSFHSANLRSGFTRARYEQAVAKVIDYIAAGDIFQANLTQRFTADFTGDYPLAPREAFSRLNTISPAWYGAYIETAPLNDQPGRVLASTSPELFLELDSRGNIVTRPIKGTRPASIPAQELIDSEKDTAELNMIVDLLRNDLGRVCDYGSVQVTQPRTVETHPTIHHGVATIEGRLHPSRDLVDLLRAALPGGSITGAPKIRAMQIIDELEPVTRGPYCGSIGYLTHDSCCLNIAIRTMLLDTANQRVDFSVGGGIVADSNPAAEYDETITKARAILEALNLAAPAEAS